MTKISQNRKTIVAEQKSKPQKTNKEVRVSAEPEGDLSHSQDNAGPVYSPAQMKSFLSLLCMVYKNLSKVSGL